MTYEVSTAEVDGVLAAPDQKPYEYFAKKVADWEEVWPVTNGERRGILIDGEVELFPVWPHPAFAEDSLTGDWGESSPKSMSLEAFLARCAEIERDGGRIAILHQANGDYLETSAFALAEDIRAQMELYE